MQIDAATLFIAVGGAAAPSLVAFSYGYGRINQKVDGLSKNVLSLAKTVKEGFEKVAASNQKRDHRLTVLETTCNACKHQ